MGNYSPVGYRPRDEVRRALHDGVRTAQGTERMRPQRNTHTAVAGRYIRNPAAEPLWVDPGEFFMRHRKTRAWTSTARPRSLNTVGRAFTAVVFGAASLTAAGLTVAGPASALPAPGPITLATGPAGEPDEATSYGREQRRRRLRSLRRRWKQLRGRTIVSATKRRTGNVSLDAASGTPALVGSMVGQFDGTTFSYTLIDGTASGTATVPAGGSSLVAAPTATCTPPYRRARPSSICSTSTSRRRRP